MAGRSTRLGCEHRSDRGPRVVLVHGFTQTGACWAPVIERLVDRWAVTTVDLPGHGASADVDADLAEAAALVADVAPEAIWVGYSLGARILLRAVLDGRIGPAAVLLGATAGIDDDAARAERRADDEARARRIEADGVDAFLDTWTTQPLFGPRRPTDADLAARRSNPAAGLAASLRRCGTGTMDPAWWPELVSVSIPTLVTWGAHDAKFAALGERLAAGIGPSARTAAIPDAHHAAHLDRPDAFVAELERFAADLT